MSLDIPPLTNGSCRGHEDADKDGSNAMPAPIPHAGIDGAAVLDKVETWFRRFIRVTFDYHYYLLVLWTVHTYLAAECHTTPRLLLDSLVEAAGKTTVLDHLQRLCHEPILIASLSSGAVVPRMLNNGVRTILLDEAHRTFNSNKPGVSDLVSIINTGYRRGATRPVMVPLKNSGWRVVEMPTFAPAALAGNDPNLANDTRSRMIRVLLMPDLDGSVEDSDWEYIEDDANALQAEIASWADSARDTVRGMCVDLPKGCVGRSKEKWRPIKRIATAAGGRWPELADELIKNALEEEAETRAAGLRTLPPGVVLLKDLREIWPAGRDFMPSQELVDLLVAHNPCYWGSESSYGKSLSETRLGRLLNQATGSVSSRPGGKGPRGYTLSAIKVAWGRLGVGRSRQDNPVNLEKPATDNSALTGLTGFTGLPERTEGFDDASSRSDHMNAQFDCTAEFDVLRAKLLSELDARGQQEPNGNCSAFNGPARQTQLNRIPEWVDGSCEYCDNQSMPFVDKETRRCIKCWRGREKVLP